MYSIRISQIFVCSEKRISCTLRYWKNSVLSFIYKTEKYEKWTWLFYLNRYRQHRLYTDARCVGYIFPSDQIQAYASHLSFTGHRYTIHVFVVFILRALVAFMRVKSKNYKFKAVYVFLRSQYLIIIKYIITERHHVFVPQTLRMAYVCFPLISISFESRLKYL